MKLASLQKELAEKLYFTSNDVARVLDITPESSRVLCSRYVKRGSFLRLKRDFYVLEQNWQRLTRGEFMKIANILQVPSYVSFASALSFYEVTTQVQQNFFENACLKRSRKIDIGEVVFNFYKLDRRYYFNFVKCNDIFIATKEKAFVDSIYLCSFGKYRLDFTALDFGKLDKSEIKRIAKVFPERTAELAEKLCGT